MRNPNWRDVRVLLTGATGFIGAHLARRLITEGAQVSAFTRRSAETLRRTEGLGALEIDWRPVDLRSYGAVANAVKSIQPDAVFHLAAEGVTDPFLSPDVAIRANVYGTIHLLRAVGGAAPVIMSRTPGEQDALNTYAASKTAAWTFGRMYHRTQGWPVVGAMLFQVYGPGQPAKALVPSASAAALRGDDFPMTHGKQQRDWIFVADAAEALLQIGWQMVETRALACETVEIGTGHTSSVRQVVESIFGMAGGPGRPLIGALPPRPGEVDRQVADAGRTEALIGWRAQTDLEYGLRETLEWMREWLNRPAG